MLAVVDTVDHNTVDSSASRPRLRSRPDEVWAVDGRNHVGIEAGAR